MQRIIESVDVGEKVMSNNPLKENIFTFWGIEMTNSVSGERSWVTSYLVGHVQQTIDHCAGGGDYPGSRLERSHHPLDPHLPPAHWQAVRPLATRHRSQ